MKKLTVTWMAILVLIVTQSFAQDAPKLYAIHEDQVMPSKNSEYMAASKSLVEILKKHNVDMSYVAVWHDDNSVIYVSELENFAQLDSNPFETLSEKIGADAMQKIWDGFNGTEYSHKDFVVGFHENLSYLPNGWPQEGENYREVFFWYPILGKENEAREVALEWKKLYEAKKVPSGYMTYSSIMGEDNPLYVFVSWGKDRIDVATKGKKVQELTGEEGAKLYEKTLKITRKFNQKSGNVMPEMSYSYSGNTEN